MALHRISERRISERRVKGLMLCAFAGLAGQLLAGTETTRFGRWAMSVGWHPDARAALSLHCGAVESPNARDDCRSHLRRQFGADEGRALAIIRLHCTRYANVWSAEAARPAPEPCRERFGGWLDG